MKKELLKDYLTQEINVKNSLLASNTIGDEDRGVIETRIAELTALVEKIDAIEDEAISIEAVDGLKEALESLNDKLTAINEKLNQNENNEEIMNIENNLDYLKSQNALHDFAQAIRGAKSAAEFKTVWGETLAANGITIAEGSEEAYLPDIVKGAIQDMFSRNGQWLKELKHTGAKRFYVRHNSADPDAEGSRAKGHKKGETKVSQNLNLAAKLIEADFIYKLIDVDKKTEWDDASLINYLVEELGTQLLNEVKRCVLVSDGRSNESDYKITSFEPMAKDTADAYTAVSTVTANGFLIDDMVNAVAAIHNPSNKAITAFMSTTTLNSLRRVAASSTSTPVYISDMQVAEMLGVEKIEKTDLLGADYVAVFAILNEYYLVGDMLNPEYMMAHDIKTNVNTYREELCVGGGINGLKSVSVLKAE